MSTFQVLALPTPASVGAGDDLVGVLLDAASRSRVELRTGDVVCVASKVVSKSEGARVGLPSADDVHASRRALALREAIRIVADTPWVMVVETPHGFVCANGGVDTSNVEQGALLLPRDPDASASAIRSGLRDRIGADVGVVITDTFGRPWRLGQTDVALGAAGVTALRDDRGTVDLQGRLLEVTMIAVADQLAAAADLARRKADGAAFVLIRGLDVAGEGAGRDLLRPADEDVFRHGRPTAIEHAVAHPDPPLETHLDRGRLVVPTPLERSLAAARGPAADDGWEVDGSTAADGSVRLTFRGQDVSPTLIDLGRAVERARLVLEAHGFVIEVTATPTGVALDATKPSGAGG